MKYTVVDGYCHCLSHAILSLFISFTTTNTQSLNVYEDRSYLSWKTTPKSFCPATVILSANELKDFGCLCWYFMHT